MSLLSENVKEMSDRQNKSCRQIQRGFKVIGITPKKYLENKQFSELLLILTSQSFQTLNLTKIAVQCGYKTYDAFRKACLRRFGMSPKKLFIAIKSGENFSENCVKLSELP